MFFHADSYFSFCSTVSQVEHERILSSWHQPCCLRSPLLQRLPNAAIVCLRPGDAALATRWARSAAGSTGPHGEKGRRTPSSWTERETDPVLPSSDTHAALSCYRHLPEKKTPNSALSPHAMEGDWGCAPVRAGPTAQTSGSKRECGAGAQGTASDRVLFLYLLAAGQYVQYLRFLERKRKQKTLIVVPSKSCGDRLCCRHRRLP